MSLTRVDELLHLPRWIKASIIRHVQMHTLGEFLFVEGEDRETNKHQKFFELRIDGPYSKPFDAGCAMHYIEVNMLMTSTKNVANFYDLEKLKGIAIRLLWDDICIYRTGNEGNGIDDNSIVGTMQVLPAEMIKTSDFGQIDDNVTLTQAVSEAHYEMYLLGA